MKYFMKYVYSIVAVGILSTMVGFDASTLLRVDFSKHSIPLDEI